MSVKNSSDNGNKMLAIKCDLNEHFILNNLEKTLLDDLKFSYEKEKCIGDELLESLHFFYKNPLLEALNQIDKFEKDLIDDISNVTNKQGSLVTLIKCIRSLKSNELALNVNTREEVKTENSLIYQVKGSIGINYYLFENINFCSCSSFKYNIFHKFDFIYCKHVVLVKLLNAMNKIAVKYVKENEFIELIKQINII